MKGQRASWSGRQREGERGRQLLVQAILRLGPMVEELDRDRPLFNDEVAVQVKFPDHEKTLALTVRVLQGSRLAPVGSGGGQREGVLHIEVTDELDSFFLFTLQVRLRSKECAAFEYRSWKQGCAWLWRFF